MSVVKSKGEVLDPAREAGHAPPKRALPELGIAVTSRARRVRASAVLATAHRLIHAGPFADGSMMPQRNVRPALQRTHLRSVRPTMRDRCQASTGARLSSITRHRT